MYHLKGLNIHSVLHKGLKNSSTIAFAFFNLRPPLKSNETTPTSAILTNMQKLSDPLPLSFLKGHCSGGPITKAYSLIYFKLGTPLRIE